MITIRVNGIETTKTSLKRAGESVQRVAELAVEAEAVEISNDWKEGVRKDQSHLVNSIGVVKRGRWTRVVRSNLPYAAAEEFGSRPHWAPLAPLIEWVKRHASHVPTIMPSKRTFARQYGYDGQLKKALNDDYQEAVEGVARGIQLKIATKGTKGSMAATKAAERAKQRFPERLRAAIRMVTK